MSTPLTTIDSPLKKEEVKAYLNLRLWFLTFRKLWSATHATETAFFCSLTLFFLLGDETRLWAVSFLDSQWNVRSWSWEISAFPFLLSVILAPWDSRDISYKRRSHYRGRQGERQKEMKQSDKSWRRALKTKVTEAWRNALPCPHQWGGTGFWSEI